MDASNQEVVYVAMSGGVDSSTAALLLTRAGFTVRGVHLRLWKNSTSKTEADADADRARAAADTLGIALDVLDYRERFRAEVVQSYLSALSLGLTPNPCIHCNRVIKWGALLEYALERGARYLASGHYAQLKEEADGSVSLWKAADRGKDQSYFLSALSQRELNHMLLPLGELTKADARRLASEAGLPDYSGSESQDLCFLGEDDQQEFFARHAPMLLEPGAIVDSQGRLLGQHRGLALYTIGQRKGIRVAAEEALYVLGKDMQANRLIVGKKEELYQDSAKARDVNWIQGQAPDLSQIYQVKIRSGAAPADASCQVLANGDMIATFKKPLRDITAGQRLVLYEGERCLGSAEITGACSSLTA